MDKYEYRIRSEEINRLIEKEKYEEAVAIADKIDWRRVKSATTLLRIAALYRVNRRKEDCRAMLQLAYDRYPTNRSVVHSLCEISIELDDVVAAIEYYKRFVKLAPRDNGVFTLRYRILAAQEASLEERIELLEELKKRDYQEEWAYELAYLYHRVGLATKCIEECDDLILWFGDGAYVMKAMELKMLHTPLTPVQQKKYEAMLNGVSSESVENDYNGYSQDEYAYADEDYQQNYMEEDYGNTNSAENQALQNSYTGEFYVEHTYGANGNTAQINQDTFSNSKYPEELYSSEAYADVVYNDEPHENANYQEYSENGYGEEAYPDQPYTGEMQVNNANAQKAYPEEEYQTGEYAQDIYSEGTYQDSVYTNETYSNTNKIYSNVDETYPDGTYEDEAYTNTNGEYQDSAYAEEDYVNANGQYQDGAYGDETYANANGVFQDEAYADGTYTNANGVYQNGTYGAATYENANGAYADEQYQDEVYTNENYANGAYQEGTYPNETYSDGANVNATGIYQNETNSDETYVDGNGVFSDRAYVDETYTNANGTYQDSAYANKSVSKPAPAIVQPNDMSQYNTINLQKVVADGMKEISLNDNTEEDEPLQQPEKQSGFREIIVEDNTLPHTKRVSELLDGISEEKPGPDTGAIRKVILPGDKARFIKQEADIEELHNTTERSVSEEQSRIENTGENIFHEQDIFHPVAEQQQDPKAIIGAAGLENVLVEWERVKREIEQRRKEKVRQHVLSQTGKIFENFDNSIKSGILGELDKDEPEIKKAAEEEALLQSKQDFYQEMEDTDAYTMYPQESSYSNKEYPQESSLTEQYESTEYYAPESYSNEEYTYPQDNFAEGYPQESYISEGYPQENNVVEGDFQENGVSENYLYESNPSKEDLQENSTIADVPENSYNAVQTQQEYDEQIFEEEQTNKVVKSNQETAFNGDLENAEESEQDIQQDNLNEDSLAEDSVLGSHTNIIPIDAASLAESNFNKAYNHELQNTKLKNKKTSEPQGIESQLEEAQSKDHSIEDLQTQELQLEEPLDINVQPNVRQPQEFQNIEYQTKESQIEETQNIDYQPNMLQLKEDQNINYQTEEPQLQEYQNIDYQTEEPQLQEDQNINYQTEEPQLQEDQNINYQTEEPQLQEDQNINYQTEEFQLQEEQNINYQTEETQNIEYQYTEAQTTELLNNEFYTETPYENVSIRNIQSETQAIPIENTTQNHTDNNRRPMIHAEAENLPPNILQAEPIEPVQVQPVQSAVPLKRKPTGRLPKVSTKTGEINIKASAMASAIASAAAKSAYEEETDEEREEFEREKAEQIAEMAKEDALKTQEIKMNTADLSSLSDKIMATTKKEATGAKREDIREFTQEEQELFENFAVTKKIKKQILYALDNMSLAGFTGNVIVTGDAGLDTVRMAKNLARRFQQLEPGFSGKIAKITGEKINIRNLKEIFDKLANGAIIIEKANGILEEKLYEMAMLLNRKNFGLVVIMEDTRKEITKLLKKQAMIADYFNIRIDLMEMDNNALVAYARNYALALEYSIDELGILALYTRIANIQSGNHVVTKDEVRDIIDEAIWKSKKSKVKNFVDVLFSKRYDSQDMIVLKERDFI